jgi:molecular chaperone HscA
MSVHVVQGERELVADCRSLARFELRGIPPMVAGAARIRVTYQVDADGLLSVSAREMSRGVEAHITVKPSYGLSDEEVTRMLQESNANAADDMRARVLREQQVESRQLLEAVQNALDHDGDALLDAAERAAITSCMATLRTQLEGAEAPALKRATAQLNEATVRFAQRRMDMNVARALGGKKISELES